MQRGMGVCLCARKLLFYQERKEEKMTISTKWIRIGNIACAVLLLALLALQMFQPFWTMPACICTEECTKAKNLADSDKINTDCPACAGYAKIKVKTCCFKVL